jgi:hypothetical protein
MVHLRHLLTFLLSLLLFPLLAQEPKQPVRLELPFDQEATDADVMALPDSSLLLYHKVSDAWGTNATFNLTKYDHQLERVWDDTFNIAPGSYFIRHFTEQPFTYLVFGEDNSREFTFVKVNYNTGQRQHRRYNLDPVDAVYEFNVLQGNYFIIGRNSKDSKPVLLHLNTTAHKVELLPSVYGDESSFSDLLADPAHGHASAVLSESNGRISRLQVKSFNARGKLLSNHFMLQQEDKSLLHAEITPGDSSERMLLGSYSTRGVRASQGFFTTPVTVGVVEEEGHLYSLLQLKNFFKYLKPRQEARLRRRETARLKSGKAPSYRYRLLLHDLITTPTGYILAAEVYYPQYRSSSSNWAFDRTVPLGRQQDGYKRSHAVVLGFNKQGELLWDNAFPLKDLTTYQLVHALELGHMPDGRVVMAYPRGEKIIYSIMNKDKFMDEETEATILTYEEDEKIQDTAWSGIIRWYGNSFAAYGFHRLKPKGSPPRTVFYINKVSF